MTIKRLALLFSFSLFFIVNLANSADKAKPKLTLDEFLNSVSFNSVKISPDGHAIVIASERADSLVVGKLDVDKHGPIAARYGVQGIPFLGLFEHGQLVRQAVGAMPKAQLEKQLGL